MSDYIDFVAEVLKVNRQDIDTNKRVVNYIKDPELWDYGNLNNDGEKYLNHISFLLGVVIKKDDKICDLVMRMSNDWRNHDKKGNRSENRNSKST